MKTSEEYAELAEDALKASISVTHGSEIWWRQAQVYATLAIAAAAHQRNEFEKWRYYSARGE